MLLIAFHGIREQGLKGWVTLPAMLLAGISESLLSPQERYLLTGDQAGVDMERVREAENGAVRAWPLQNRQQRLLLKVGFLRVHFKCANCPFQHGPHTLTANHYLPNASFIV